MKTLKIKTPQSFEMLGITRPLTCHVPEYLNLRLLKTATQFLTECYTVFG